MLDWQQPPDAVYVADDGGAAAARPAEVCSMRAAQYGREHCEWLQHHNTRRRVQKGATYCVVARPGSRVSIFEVHLLQRSSLGKELYQPSRRAFSLLWTVPFTASLHREGFRRLDKYV